jgi:cell division protein FtsQ
VVVLAAVVWAVWFSSLLSARQVRVVGAEGAWADAALAAAAVPVGVPLVRIDTARAEQAVAALPWVAAVDVRRGWPAEIVVAVTAREPRAALAGSRRAVDAQGIAFDVVGALPKDLPKVTAEGVALTEAMAVLTSLPPDIARRVVAVRATTRDDVDLTLRSGDVVRWGSAGQAAFKAEVLRALLDRRADVYDVSAPELPTTFRSR